MINIFNKLAPLPVAAEEIDNFRNAVKALKAHAIKIYNAVPHISENDRMVDRALGRGPDNPYVRSADIQDKCHAADMLGPALEYYILGDQYALHSAYGFRNIRFSDDFSSISGMFEGSRFKYYNDYSIQGILNALETSVEGGYHQFDTPEQQGQFLDSLATIKSFMSHLRVARTPQINNNLVNGTSEPRL